jgi:hypothetical protein
MATQEPQRAYDVMQHWLDGVINEPKDSDDPRWLDFVTGNTATITNVAFWAQVAQVEQLKRIADSLERINDNAASIADSLVETLPRLDSTLERLADDVSKMQS